MSDAARTGQRRGTLSQQESRTGLAMISPTLVIVVLVVIVPVLWTVLLSFQRIRLLTLRSAGLFGSYTLSNYIDILTSSGFRQSLITTLVYTVLGTISSIGVGLVAALVVRRPFRGRTVVRVAMLLPYVAPVVAMTFVWRIMLNPQFGIINDAGVQIFGWRQPVPFLSEEVANLSVLGTHIGVPTALLTVVAFEAWRYFPFAFLFILARLQAMPGEYEEAAWVDGATPTQRFAHVVWPQLRSVIGVLVVLRFIWTFNKFDDVYLLTGGGAGTDVASVRVYQLLTAQADIGGSAAQAAVLAVILAICLIVYFGIVNRSSSTEERA